MDISRAVRKLIIFSAFMCFIICGDYIWRFAEDCMFSFEKCGPYSIFIVPIIFLEFIISVIILAGIKNSNLGYRAIQKVFSFFASVKILIITYICFLAFSHDIQITSINSLIISIICILLFMLVPLWCTISTTKGLKKMISEQHISFPEEIKPTCINHAFFGSLSGGLSCSLSTYTVLWFIDKLQDSKRKRHSSYDLWDFWTKEYSDILLFGIIPSIVLLIIMLLNSKLKKQVIQAHKEHEAMRR